MNKQKIETTQAPAAIGPYSQAILAGNLLFLSGQIPLDPATGEIVAGGIEEQTRQVMSNLQAVLQAADLDFVDLVKILLSSIQFMGSVLPEPFPQHELRYRWQPCRKVCGWRSRG